LYKSSSVLAMPFVPGGLGAIHGGSHHWSPPEEKTSGTRWPCAWLKHPSHQGKHRRAHGQKDTPTYSQLPSVLYITALPLNLCFRAWKCDKGKTNIEPSPALLSCRQDTHVARSWRIINLADPCDLLASMVRCQLEFLRLRLGEFCAHGAGQTDAAVAGDSLVEDHGSQVAPRFRLVVLVILREEPHELFFCSTF